MGNDTSLVIIVLILLAVVRCCVSACKCVDPPTTCTGNFAIRGRITDHTGNQTLHDDITYTVEVLQLLRHPSHHIDQPAGTTVTIVTGSHSCGYPELETGGVYFIAGDFQPPSDYKLFKCGGLVIRYDPDGNLPYVGDSSPCSACLTSIASSVFVLSLIISLFLK